MIEVCSKRLSKKRPLQFTRPDVNMRYKSDLAEGPNNFQDRSIAMPVQYSTWLGDVGKPELVLKLRNEGHGDKLQAESVDCPSGLSTR
jgi:hypothetical protein